MTPASRAQCVCSPVGFENPAWDAQYYPGECPRDWRLAYYMNDFRALYLAASAWTQSEEQIAAIAAELEAGFDLIVEWPAVGQAGAPDVLLSKLELLKQNIVCVVIGVDGVADSELAETCRAIAAIYPINLGSERLDRMAQVAMAKRYDAGFVWHPERTEQPVEGSNYQVVRLQYQGLRQARAVLAALGPVLAQDVRVGLFVDAAENSAARALEMRTLVELMGLA